MTKEFWQEYERRKANIAALNMSPEDYEREIRQLLEDMDSESDEAAA